MGGAGGSAFIRPGRKKLAGETLREAENPPQPTASHATTGMTNSRQYFQCNLTKEPLYYGS